MAVVKFEVPAEAQARIALLNELVDVYKAEYAVFKASGKKASGNRAKKTLTNIKKLITPVRRDIADEVEVAKKPA
jgi:hypothetical protein